MKRKALALISCKCSRDIIVFWDGNGELQIEEYSPELKISKNEVKKYDL